MDFLLDSIRDQLLDRKNRILNFSSSSERPEHLYELLRKVDKALERMDAGSYGVCEVCHDPIEPDRLLADPLLTVCLDHLNKDQQRALEADLSDAGRIQRALLPPKDIKIDGWEFSYHYSPAGVVSGDFCDLIPAADGSVIFVIGDVSGKGISASLMMSHLNALIHSLVSFNLPLSEILLKVNRLFCESTISANYATMIAGKASADGLVDICVAGHNPPFYINNGEVYPVHSTGFPVGFFCDSEYGVEKFRLEKNDSLILYTDGYTEASVEHVEYGELRLKNHLPKIHELGAKEILDNLLSEHKKFLKDIVPGDDITLAVLKRT